ncbi:hypothetical protein ACFLWB_02535 [Chloroflexota bacterium]
MQRAIERLKVLQEEARDLKAGDYHDLMRANETRNLVDIGLLLCRHLDDKLSLTCADANVDMLETLGKYLNKHGVSNIISIHANAENQPSQVVTRKEN